ncbi:hypothetical protein RchiOBHm_Chr3g0475451 [Rosa chinensis]|uniref:Uncharacterized protein n=1 Tax=Rosa chinensis TaxID=74649 RepID=A0A2P6RCF5_ROSCH|nr:hypothetical protein RchiOBHm_Chr3g0475451 [Rosa chinensis]
MDGGFEVGEGGGGDGRVVVEEGEEVEADGVEVEGLVVEVGGGGGIWGLRDLRIWGDDDDGVLVLVERMGK